VEAPLLVVAWHGLYSLSDNYIYPDNRQLSMIISFGSGYLIYFLLALIQIPVVRCLLKQNHRWLHTCVSNLFHLIAFVSVVQIWRSLWIICEQYLNIPEYHNLTLWLCYGVSFVVLTCGLAACSLNGPGGSKDGYIDEEPILLFKFDYFSTLLKVSLMFLVSFIFSRKLNFDKYIHRFQQQQFDDTLPSQTSSHSGIFLWLITNVLRRKQQRRNSLMNESRRNTVTSIDVPPTISGNITVN
jgi:hypothetical protein